MMKNFSFCVKSLKPKEPSLTWQFIDVTSFFYISAYFHIVVTLYPFFKWGSWKYNNKRPYINQGLLAFFHESFSWGNSWEDLPRESINGWKGETKSLAFSKGNWITPINRVASKVTVNNWPNLSKETSQRTLQCWQRNSDYTNSSVNSETQMLNMLEWSPCVRESLLLPYPFKKVFGDVFSFLICKHLCKWHRLSVPWAEAPRLLWISWHH